MAFLKFENVRIAGLSAGVPKTILQNTGDAVQSKDYDAEAFVKLTGVKERRVGDYCTSDLCYAAAERLISDLNWSKDDIDALIFVSQTADYFLPATSCILQERLKLSKECYAEDISLGCSGWVYGMSTILGLMQGGVKKALLMAGDAKRHSPAVDADPLFGFAGTVTALEYDPTAKPILFHMGTDGSGYDAIICPDGGSRNQFSIKSYEVEEIDGKKYNRFQTRMKGMDVFAFGITTAPKSIKKLCSNFDIQLESVDYIVLHQANMKMNDMIIKKLKIPLEKAPSSMYHFGNTSSASIPLTIVTQLKDMLYKKNKQIIGCGFGVGLSWGTIAFETENIIISELVEI